MNILLVTEFFPDPEKPIFTGGVENRAYYTGNYLSLNNKVTIISRRLEGQKPKESKGNLEIIRLGTPQKNAEASISSLLSRLIFQINAVRVGIKQKADLVEGSNFITYLPAFLIGKILKIPKIAWYPDVFIGRWVKLFGPILGLMGEISEKVTLSLSWDGIIAISSSTKKKIISSNAKGKIEVIYCGIEKKEYKDLEKFEKPTLIVISRLIKYKNIDMVLKAANNFNLIIVGTGPEEERLRQIALDLKISNRVSFKKNLTRPELLTLLAKSHLLCHPSSEEGFGIVILESLASNTPFIASKIPAIVEITENGKGGALFNPLDQEAFEKNIKELLNNPNLYRLKQKEGKMLVGKYFRENLSKETGKFFNSIKI